MRLFLAVLVRLALPALAFARANPADRLAHRPIEESVYDRATHCDDTTRRGVVKLRRWLEENARGVFWATDSAGNAQALARRMGVEELRDHIHVGMTKAGAAGKTSFWRGHTG